MNSIELWTEPEVLALQERQGGPMTVVDGVELILRRHPNGFWRWEVLVQPNVLGAKPQWEPARSVKELAEIDFDDLVWGLYALALLRDDSRQRLVARYGNITIGQDEKHCWIGYDDHGRDVELCDVYAEHPLDAALIAARMAMEKRT